jgi:ribonuclease HI
MEGKETLIKSMLQAVATYPMGCFQLSKKMCNSLKSISSGFWWGTANGRRKVPWIAWDKLCMPKRRGGMGFRDFEAFNQALLAKQAWRLLTISESLCAQVLRARYYKDGTVLTANCPNGASYTWRSIVHGRDLLKEGLVWRVGSGKGIKVMEDNWIPRSGLQHPWSLKPNVVINNVCDLLLEGGQGWCEEKLNASFYEEDVTDILQIPVGCAGTEDYAAWNYTKNGIFSIRSAYHLNMHLKRCRMGGALSSFSMDEHRGWLALWAAEVPGKAKIHVWRLIKNGLAVGQELERRNIKHGVRCIVCNRDESLIHRFWQCPHSYAIWELVHEQTGLWLRSPDATVLRQRELTGWILDWLGQLEDRELAVGIMVLYQMWLERNDAREEDRISDPQDVVRRSLFLVDEWAAAQQKDSQRSEASTVTERWLPPEADWYKVNADGAFVKESGEGGCGVVLRNHHGEFVSAACHFLPLATDPERAEILACKRALQLAKEMEVTKVCLETDYLSAVVKLRSSEKDRSAHGPLVEEIKELLWSFMDHSVSHVRRSCNGVAHVLAKESCTNKFCNVWTKVPPMYVVNLLASEGVA